MVIHIYASPYIPNSRLEWDLVLELGGRYREGQSGSSLQDSRTPAMQTYQQQFIGDSRPPGTSVDMDAMMRFGAPLDPVDAQDALSWQRARTFSHYAQQIGLAPGSVFQLMEALALDMHDSLLDGHDVAGPHLI